MKENWCLTSHFNVNLLHYSQLVLVNDLLLRVFNLIVAQADPAYIHKKIEPYGVQSTSIDSERCTH